TVSVNATTLTFPNNLIGNTTYFVRIGSLWNGGTNYFTLALGTSTLSDQVTGQQTLAVSSWTAQVGWAAQVGGSGIGTSEGYLLQASTDPAFGIINGSSQTALMSAS